MLEWDLFCRVIDNHGDIGVCWRLAADLASRGQPVRLWVDDASALAWMAPHGAPGVSMRSWPSDPPPTDGPCRHPHGAPGPVVIEAFGCDLPPAFAAAMAAMPQPPVWIDLEYLSAEGYVERSHLLPSPQLAGPAAGLTRHFFYPGFTTATGGLIREPDLLAAQKGFDAADWLARFGLARRQGERVVSLFCYRQPALAALLERLAEAPSLLLLTPGPASQQAALWRTRASAHPLLRLAHLPLLTQADFDRLLWACDLNFVRGEDSFVRAQWAGVPFVWQAYPQAEGRHRVKLDAFLDRLLAGADTEDDADAAAAIRDLWSTWNGGHGTPPLAWPPQERWRRLCLTWRARLLGQADLSTQLMRFAAEVAAAQG